MPEHHRITDDTEACPYDCKTSKLTQEIHSALLGTSDGSREGLVAKVSRHDKQLAGFTRFGWIVIGSLVVAGVAIIQASVQ